VGEFPEGEFPGASENQAGAAGSQSGSEQAGTASDPGFGEGASGGESLPNLLDEPSFEEALGAMEGAMGDPGQNSGSGESGSAAGDGESGMGGAYGIPDSTPGGTPGGGPLTPAEQVAILDAQLERGTGEFDSMILEEQAEQRRTARSQPPSESKAGASESGSGGYGGGYGGASPDGDGTGGGYSTGGGMGGASAGGQIPRNTAKYPPPKDIPSGNDDDVVARQLREAAMSEPDPAVREKLWDEYRKYKGIGQ
jgi:hypothetical protein